MARPLKNNADYFPHDAGMRNHKKVKAIRSKFGIQGYGIWSMLLEHLTGSDGNVFPYTDLEFELMSGDFGISATEIRVVVDYCLSLEMLFNESGFIKSESLDERLAPVFEKRQKAKELSKQQLRSNGKYVTETLQDTVISVAETPQRKGKESTEEESKREESNNAPEERNFDWFKMQIDEVWTDQLPKEKKINLGAAIENAWTFLTTDSHRLKIIDASGCKKLVNNAFGFIKTDSKNGTPKRNTNSAEVLDENIKYSDKF